MREVSCRVFDVTLRFARKKGVPVEALLTGLTYSLDHLKNRHERVEWATYARFMKNAQAFFTAEELITLGGAVLESPLIRPFTLIARLLFSARDAYLWVYRDQRFGHELFTCLHSRVQEPEEGVLEIALELDPGYEMCEPTFLVTKGGLVNGTRILGLPRAEVEMVLLERGARYLVRLPRGGGWLPRLMRALTRPFLGLAAARELNDANRALQLRYAQLEQARQALDHQAQQLKTAYAISERVHSTTTLPETMRAIAECLTDVGGFTGAELSVVTTLEGKEVHERIERGQGPGTIRCLEYPLSSRGAPLGNLRLCAAADSVIAEKKELLEYVVPTIEMALRDAATMDAVVDYRTNLEQRVVDRTVELSLAKDELSQTVEELRRAQATRERIFANINHEIRTPLALVRLATERIRKQLPPERETLRPDFESIDSNVRRLLNLIDELLLLAASQEGKLVIRPIRRNLARLLKRAVAGLKPAADSANLSLHLLAPERLFGVVDAHAFERIVGNLVSNAIKFTPAGGRIDVELVAREGDIKLEVRDTGIGLDEEFKDRIFGRFEQGQSPVRPGAASTGLGLSLVKELVQAHGGGVTATANPGGGSVFTISLPKEVHAPLDDTASDPLAPPVEQSGWLRKPDPGARVLEPTSGTSEATILVAEDEPELREALGNLLSDRHRVLLAPDGLTALRLATDHLPDLLLSDVGMPGMDGFELTRRFQELPGSRLASVILLTAFAGDTDRLAGLAAGAVDYLVKPFHPEELLARVKAQLRIRSLALHLHESEKLAALGSLSAGLAHEFRNPANAIVNAIGPLRSLLPGELLEPTSGSGQLLEVIAEAATQITHLARQLLGFIRGGDARVAQLRVDELVQRSMHLVAPVLKSVRVELDLQQPGTFVGAQAPLMQVLSNLLENAAYAAGEGGWVRIHSREEADRLFLEIIDSGPGVPPELRGRIFEPFFTTKPPNAGTGLGLAIARQIVEQHRGTLDLIDSSKGTVFRITLPKLPANLTITPAGGFRLRIGG